MPFNEWLAYLSEWLGVTSVAILAGISPRFKKRPLIFLYPRREGYIALALYAILLVVSFFIYNRGLLANLAITSNFPESLVPRVFTAVAGLVLFAVALFVRRQPLLSVRWGTKLMRPALLLGVALAFLTLFLRGKFLAVLDGVTPQETSALLGCLILSLGEESIFRGYIQSRLSTLFGDRLGWLSTALLYAIWNVPRLMGSPQGLLLGLLLALIQGVLLGWVIQKSGHILAPMLYRAISEWIAFL
jgi:membrane protease YdiL (CAAX protease family)